MACSGAAHDWDHITNCMRKHQKNGVITCAILPSFPNLNILLLYRLISILMISSGSSAHVSICSMTRLENGESKLLAYIRNLISNKSLWTLSEETLPPLNLLKCCYNGVDYFFSIFLASKTTLGLGMGEKEVSVQCFCLRL